MNKQRTIGIQGIQGCFHQMAAQLHFGNEIDVLECLSFRELCDSLKKGTCDFAVMAIENTIAGSILTNYALLQEFQFSICGEIYLPIQLHLLALPGAELRNIKRISSHHMAIKQSEVFINQLQPVECIEMEDTALAAKRIRENNVEHDAAIANELTAKLYKLDILARGIETNRANYTRFLVLSKTPVQSEEHNKASLFLELNHQPGSLAEILMVFKNREINLTKIQSVPILGKPYEYAFHIDLEWRYRSCFDESLMEIKKSVSQLAVLGTYKKANWNGNLNNQ
jgi:prephenate dehydratase